MDVVANTFGRQVIEKAFLEAGIFTLETRVMMFELNQSLDYQVEYNYLGVPIQHADNRLIRATLFFTSTTVPIPTQPKVEKALAVLFETKSILQSFQVTASQGSPDLRWEISFKATEVTFSPLRPPEPPKPPPANPAEEFKKMLYKRKIRKI